MTDDLDAVLATTTPEPVTSTSTATPRKCGRHRWYPLRDTFYCARCGHEKDEVRSRRGGGIVTDEMTRLLAEALERDDPRGWSDGEAEEYAINMLAHEPLRRALEEGPRLRAALEDIESRRCQAAVWHDIPDRWLVCMDFEYNDDEPTQPCPPCIARTALQRTEDPTRG